MEDSDSQPIVVAEVTPERMKEIISGLKERDLGRQNYWMRQLLEVGPSAIPYLQSELRREGRWRSIVANLGLVVVGLVLSIAAIQFLLYGRLFGLGPVISAASLLTPLHGMYMMRPGATKTRLAGQLAGAAIRMRHTEAVVLLLELWRFEAGASLNQSLTEVLPSLKASDTSLLTPAHRETLNLILSNGSSADVKLAVLKALEQIGDESAVPFVEELANTRSFNRGEIKLSEAAKDALPFIRARAASTKLSNTLLRTTEQSGEASLLRPASNTQVIDETLLHAMGDD